MASNYYTDKDIPLDADKLLFANDLVNHVISMGYPDTAPEPLSVNGSQRYRESIYNAFTDTIKKAVETIYRMEEPTLHSDFSKILAANKVNEESLISTEGELRTRFLFKELDFNHRGFLKYSVSLAVMASYFLANGIKDAREICINHIVLTFANNSFMDREFREKMHAAALDYAQI